MGDSGTTTNCVMCEYQIIQCIFSKFANLILPGSMLPENVGEIKQFTDKIWEDVITALQRDTCLETRYKK